MYYTPKFRWLPFPSELTRLWFSPNEGYQFPRKIEGGESLTQRYSWADHFQSLKKLGLEPRRITKVWFLSSTGEYYVGKIPKVTIEVLQEQFDAFIKEQSTEPGDVSK